MTTTQNTAAPRTAARWYCGSSAATIGSRELGKLLAAYREDGAQVTSDRNGGYTVRIPGEKTRNYDRA